MQSGAIGTASVLRSQTCDKLDPSGFFVAYALDGCDAYCRNGLHFTSVAEEPEGQVDVVDGAVDEHNDRDNAVGLVEFYDGRMAYFYASRMMAAGQEDMEQSTKMPPENSAYATKKPLGSSLSQV
jgi:myo-inositol 2-dehydrogenase/D-chiro-inositol 1-dehydrogenase